MESKKSRRPERNAPAPAESVTRNASVTPERNVSVTRRPIARIGTGRAAEKFWAWHDAYPNLTDSELLDLIIKDPPRDLLTAGFHDLDKLLVDLEHRGLPRDSIARLRDALALERLLKISLHDDPRARAELDQAYTTITTNLSKWEVKRPGR